MANCKKCVHKELCETMRRFGIAGLPYGNDSAECKHSANIPDISPKEQKTCKDCAHKDLCKDMHKYGTVDAPYREDNPACDLFDTVEDIAIKRKGKEEVLKEIRELIEDDIFRLLLAIEAKEKKTDDQDKDRALSFGTGKLVSLRCYERYISELEGRVYEPIHLRKGQDGRIQGKSQW